MKDTRLHLHAAPALALLAISSSLAAQVVGGTISGLATDQAGAPITAAPISIRNLETGSRRLLHTDASGSYAAPSLPVGRYRVTIEKEGFATEAREVDLTVGQALHLNLSLAIGTIAEAVTVATTALTINPSTQETSGLVSDAVGEGVAGGAAMGFVPAVGGLDAHADAELEVGGELDGVFSEANPAAGSSSYHALEADLRRSFFRGFQLRANYTFAKNLDNGSTWNTSVSSNTPAFVSVPQLPRLDWGPAATDIRHLAAVNATYDLPLGHGHRLAGNAGPRADHLLSGFTLATIVSLQTGFPFSPQLGYNPTGSGDTRNPIRPNLNPAFTASRYATGSTRARVTQFFNPDAFSAPAYGTVGNLGRDTLTGPGYADWDISLAKTTHISEALRAELRGEFFNVLNHSNLGTPNEVVYASGPTQGAATSQLAAAVTSPTAGVITTASTSRQIQLSLKFLF